MPKGLKEWVKDKKNQEKFKSDPVAQDAKKKPYFSDEDRAAQKAKKKRKYRKKLEKKSKRLQYVRSKKK